MSVASAEGSASPAFLAATRPAAQAQESYSLGPISAGSGSFLGDFFHGIQDLSAQFGTGLHIATVDPALAGAVVGGGALSPGSAARLQSDLRTNPNPTGNPFVGVGQTIGGLIGIGSAGAGTLVGTTAQQAGPGVGQGIGAGVSGIGQGVGSAAIAAGPGVGTGVGAGLAGIGTGIGEAAPATGAGLGVGVGAAAGGIGQGIGAALNGAGLPSIGGIIGIVAVVGGGLLLLFLLVMLLK